MNHPIQPLVTDDYGTIRFKKNAIVDYLVADKLNELARMDFSNEDWMQLAQLLGYSIGGYGSLSYVSDESYETACAMAEHGKSETEVKIEYLQDELKALKDGLRKPMARLFGKHVDDLK